MIFEIFLLIDRFSKSKCFASRIIFPQACDHPPNSALRLFAKQENILQLGSAIDQTASKSNVAKFNIYPLFGYKSRTIGKVE